MKLDSVRSMKEEVKYDILGGRFGPMDDIAMSEMSDLPPMPSFALGISTEAESSGDTSNDHVEDAVDDTSDRYTLAVRLEDASDLRSPELSRILALAHGKVDVQVTGHMKALTGADATKWNHQKLRPLQIGTSVGHQLVTCGTIAAFVRKRGGSAEDMFILSNAHVIANEDKGQSGDAVLQPGRCDGGSVSRDLVARLTIADSLSRRGWNLTDSAIAQIERGVTADFTSLRGLGKLKGISTRRIHKNMYVAKVGRTTNVTHGYVTAFELDIPIGFSFGRAWFRNQIEVRGAAYGAFVEGGDSGSLAVDSEGRAVGLIFAGGARTGILNPIQTVLDRLGVELALA